VELLVGVSFEQIAAAKVVSPALPRRDGRVCACTQLHQTAPDLPPARFLGAGRLGAVGRVLIRARFRRVMPDVDRLVAEIFGIDLERQHWLGLRFQLSPVHAAAAIATATKLGQCFAEQTHTPDTSSGW
jgi:hypothetical protein